MTQQTKPLEKHLARRYRFHAACLDFLRTRISQRIHRSRATLRHYGQLPIDIGFMMTEVYQGRFPDPKPLLEKSMSHLVELKAQIARQRQQQDPKLENLAAAESLHGMLASAVHHINRMLAAYRQSNLTAHS